jgi:hypothetical protein
MPQTTINCPRCKQPIQANVEQLFDVTSDPGAKQRLLSGVSNFAHCPFCGYEGQLATPIVYHDADKQLLLTYFPAEIGMPVNEQEKLIGPMITQVTNKLPPEKRKAYLLSPQAHLSFQSLVERILAADGVAPEMLKAQQDRVSLIERLLKASGDDVRKEILGQEPSLADEQFFALFSRLLQSAAASGDEQVAKEMARLQNLLLEETEYGRKIQASYGEMEAAAKSLQEAGKELTREKLLDIIIEAPNDERLSALVSLARPGLDYVFFQTLTEKIDKAQGEEKQKLEALREKLLDLVNMVDKQIEERYKQAQQFVDEILAQDDIAQATRDSLDAVNQDVVDVINTMLREASDKKDSARLEKLQQMVQILQESSVPPPEVAFIEKLLDAPDEAAIEKMLQENEAMVNDNFMEALSGLSAQMDAQAEQLGEENKAIAEKLGQVFRTALKYTMKRNIKTG